MHMAAHPAGKHIDGAKRRLAHLAGLAATTADTERRILAAAEHRLAAVDADLGALRPRTVIDPDAADRYRALTLERGQIEIVIGRAREHLA